MGCIYNTVGYTKKIWRGTVTTTLAEAPRSGASPRGSSAWIGRRAERGSFVTSKRCTQQFDFTHLTGEWRIGQALRREKEQGLEAEGTRGIVPERGEGGLFLAAPRRRSSRVMFPRSPRNGQPVGSTAREE